MAPVPPDQATDRIPPPPRLPTYFHGPGVFRSTKRKFILRGRNIFSRTPDSGLVPLPTQRRLGRRSPAQKSYPNCQHSSFQFPNSHFAAPQCASRRLFDLLQQGGARWGVGVRPKPPSALVQSLGRFGPTPRADSSQTAGSFPILEHPLEVHFLGTAVPQDKGRTSLACTSRSAPGHVPRAGRHHLVNQTSKRVGSRPSPRFNRQLIKAGYGFAAPQYASSLEVDVRALSPPPG